MFFVMGTAATCASAKDLRYATGYPPNSVGSYAAEYLANEVKEQSDDKLNVKVFASSLLSLSETPSGVGMGMADLGLVVTPYFPAEFPTTNLIADLSMNVDPNKVDGQTIAFAYTGAISEYLFTDCPNCEEEYKSQNQIFVGGGSSPPYLLLCTKPVTSMEEVQGARLRVGGSLWSRWASYIGATSVTMPQNETYEALSQGVIDCVISSAPELTNFKLIEVVTDITPAIPGGVFSGIANTINRDVWSGLTKAQRKTVLRGGAAFAADMTWRYTIDAKRDIARVENDPEKRVHQASNDIVAKTEEFIASDSSVLESRYNERYKDADVSSMISDFKALLDTWIAKVEAADITSKEDLKNLYWSEIYSKVDTGHYGL